MKLTPNEMERYDRQIRIRGLGKNGQLKLKKARVMVAGAGGLGCPASLYLVAAGVGYLAIVDKETVELSNLNRQVLHWGDDVGKLKSVSVLEKLHQLNPGVEVEAIPRVITPTNARELVHGFTVVVDGMDNWRTRFVLNEACVRENVPFVHAGVHSLYGQITTILPGKVPAYNAFYPRSRQRRKNSPF